MRIISPYRYLFTCPLSTETGSSLWSTNPHCFLVLLTSWNLGLLPAECIATTPWPLSLFARVAVTSISVLTSVPPALPAPGHKFCVSQTEISAHSGSVPWDESLTAQPSLHQDQSPEDRQTEPILNLIKVLLKLLHIFEAWFLECLVLLLPISLLFNNQKIHKDL